MDARDLRFFVAVAEELHFSRAAARLRIVPAAVSQRIRDLEAELGVALFERTSRRVVLTPAGQRLLGPSRTVLADLASVSELARSLASGASGRVSLALAPNLGSFGARFVAEVVPVLPGLEVVGESMWGGRAVEALAHGEVVAAVVRGPVEGSGLSAVTVGTHHDGFVALPEDDPLAGSPAVSVELLEGAPLMISDRVLAPVIHDRTVAFFAAHGVAPQWRHHRMQGYEQVMTFVAAGYAATLVHSHLADVRFPGVVVRPLLQAAPVYEVVLAWRSDDASPAVRTLASTAARLFGSSPGR